MLKLECERKNPGVVILGGRIVGLRSSLAAAEAMTPKPKWAPDCFNDSTTCSQSSTATQILLQNAEATSETQPKILKQRQ